MLTDALAEGDVDHSCVLLHKLVLENEPHYRSG